MQTFTEEAVHPMYQCSNVAANSQKWKKCTRPKSPRTDVDRYSTEILYIHQHNLGRDGLPHKNSEITHSNLYLTKTYAVLVRNV